MTQRLHFPEDVQQFEKAVLGRSSRSRTTAAKAGATEDDSENDKGTGSEDENDEAPKRRPVSPMSSFRHCRVHYDLRNTFRSMQGQVLWLFCKINPMKNDASHLVQYIYCNPLSCE